MKIDSSDFCAAAFGGECPPSNCGWRCAIEIIDELLCHHSISGEQADLFLDLRWQLARQENAEESLRIFSFLRVKAEPSHYLAFFRIRKWIENNIEAHVFATSDKTVIPVKLDYVYCVEALRRQCLCAAAKNGLPLQSPSLRFAYKHSIITAIELVAALSRSS